MVEEWNIESGNEINVSSIPRQSMDNSMIENPDNSLLEIEIASEPTYDVPRPTPEVIVAALGLSLKSEKEAIHDHRESIRK